MIKFLLNLANWIYKKKCYFCSKSHENTIMCSKCYEKIDFLPTGANKIISGVNIFCACEYKGTLQKLIRGIKYHKKGDLAFYQAKLMYEYWKKLDKTEKYIVVPVPLSKERQKKRKYNQMELVGEEFCKMSGYDMKTDLIERVKNTKPQYKLTRKQRMENLDEAFKINLKNYNGGPILLIDDICTTGATFESIITELQKNNINNITCFATSTP